jgi:hypothetical protein
MGIWFGSVLQFAEPAGLPVLIREWGWVSGLEPSVAISPDPPLRPLRPRPIAVTLSSAAIRGAARVPWAPASLTPPRTQHKTRELPSMYLLGSFEMHARNTCLLPFFDQCILAGSSQLPQLFLDALGISKSEIFPISIPTSCVKSSLHNPRWSQTSTL